MLAHREYMAFWLVFGTVAVVGHALLSTALDRWWPR
jgi:hypothetical protein